jgi:hypothetical protein
MYRNRRSLFLTASLIFCVSRITLDAAEPAVDPSRFEITELANGLIQPMELAISADGVVFFIELAGQLKRIDPIRREVTLAGELNVKTAGSTFSILHLIFPGNTSVDLPSLTENSTSALKRFFSSTKSSAKNAVTTPVRCTSDHAVNCLYPPVITHIHTVTLRDTLRWMNGLTEPPGTRKNPRQTRTAITERYSESGRHSKAAMRFRTVTCFQKTVLRDARKSTSWGVGIHGA